jgi:2-oxo-hept-3-ene-1,7-dioate hydratase
MADQPTRAIEELAAMLADAWHRPGNLVAVDRALVPADRAQACLAQDLMFQKLGEALVGWKVGATSHKMRQLDGHDDVIPGRIIASRTHIGPRHDLQIGHFHKARAETEFAFRLTATPHLRDTPWTSGEMAEIMVLHPAIELIGNRYQMVGASKAENSLMTIADNGGGIGFVFGDPVTDWQHIDFQNHRIDLQVSGGAPADNFLGDMRCVPAEAAADLVNHLAHRGEVLEAGHFISTGAASVPQPFGGGDVVHADFGVLGTIELRF